MSKLQPAWEEYKAIANAIDLLVAAKMCGAELKRLSGGEHVGPCPACGGRDRFSVNVNKQKWNCRGHGGGSQSISLVMHAAGLDFKGACELLTGEKPPTGEPGGIDHQARALVEERRRQAERDRARREAEEARRQEFREELAIDLWQHSIAPEGTLAEVYYKSRVNGWDGFHSDVIRFHPAAFYSKSQRLPCIVHRVDGPDGNPVGVWRIFLDENGNKAPVEDCKKGLGPCAEKGGAIRLISGSSSTIAVTEGVESAYGAWNLAHREMPAWALMSTSGMMNFQPPFEIERVVGFPDGDTEWDATNERWREPPGRKAWRGLEARLRGEGIATGMHPTKWDGTDPLDIWNDFYDRFGPLQEAVA
jgi:putative DNA primase/helicase